MESIGEVQIRKHPDVVVHVGPPVRSQPDVRDFLEARRVTRLELFPELSLPGRELHTHDVRGYVAAPVNVNEFPIRAPLRRDFARFETRDWTRLRGRDRIHVDLPLGTARDDRLPIRRYGLAPREADSLGSERLRFAAGEVLDVEAGSAAGLVAGEEDSFS